AVGLIHEISLPLKRAGHERTSARILNGNASDLHVVQTATAARPGLADGKRHGAAGAATRRRCHTDVSTGALYQTPCEPQPHSAVGSLARDEAGVEEPRQRVWAERGTIVLHREADARLTAHSLRPQPHLAPVRGGECFSRTV